MRIRSSGKCVVHLGVKGGFGEQHGVLLWRDTEFIVEGVVPDLLHVIPVCDNPVVDRVLEGEDTTLRLGLITVGGWARSVCSAFGLLGHTARAGQPDAQVDGDK